MKKLVVILMFFISFRSFAATDAEACGPVGLKLMEFGLGLESAQEIERLLAGTPQAEQQLNFFLSLPTPTRKLLKHLKPSETVAMFQVLVTQNPQELLRKFTRSSIEMSTAEIRAASLLWTQSLEFDSQLLASRKHLTRLMKNLRLKNLLDDAKNPTDSRLLPILVAKRVIGRAFKHRSLTQTLLLRRAQTQELVMLLQNSPLQNTISAEIQHQIKEAEAVLVKTKGLRKIRLKFRIGLAKEFLVALAPEEARLMGESEGLLYKVGHKTVFSVIPTVGQTAIHLTKGLLVSAVVYWGFYHSYGVIQNPARAPIFVFKSSETIPRIAPQAATETPRDQLYNLQEEYYSGELAESDYRTRYSKILADHPELRNQ